MGILVASATLPSGVQVNNVYMSYNRETVHITPLLPSGTGFRVFTHYNVFGGNDQSKVSNIRIIHDFNITESEIEDGIYFHLYDKLKLAYPGAVDKISAPIPTTPVTL